MNRKKNLIAYIRKKKGTGTTVSFAAATGGIIFRGDR
jgi:hypothetical protein